MDGDALLRENVSRLGHLLGETLEALEGKSVFAHVELARRTARDRREDRPGAEERFERVLHGLSPREAMSVSRAFSSYFGLVNLAQQAHRVHTWRESLAGKAAAEASFEHVLGMLRAAGHDPATMADELARLVFKPVFTAHPTNAVRRTLLIKEQHIADALMDGRDPDTIRDEIALAWQTDEHFDQPTVGDEVEHLMFYLSNTIYQALPALYRRLGDALERVYGRRHGIPLPPQLVRFGSWVGGDMDGNPNVDAGTIVGTLERQRQLVIERYRRDVRALFEHLSQSTSRITVSTALAGRLDRYLGSLDGIDEAIPSRYVDMPYRMFLSCVWHRLGATAADGADGYAGPEELLADLELVTASLAGHGSTGARPVEELIVRVRCFGFHLAALDVRQDAAVHRAAVAQALGRPDFAELDVAARCALLREAMRAPPEASGAGGGAELDASLAVFRAVEQAQTRFGARAIGLYIISMARDVDDALAVLFLARLANPEREHPRLDVAPLFETVDDLERAPHTLRALLDDDHYEAHLAARGRLQHVMLGYSDSNKQAGMASSRFALQLAQRQLLEVMAGHPDLEMVLFHGRGGTISRGGGETRNGVLAEPPGALAGTLRVTEQGEIIGQKYGLEEVATQTMELALGALLERRVADGLEPPADSDWVAVAATVAEASRDAYRTLLEHPEFIPFFRQATPIDVIERLRIGSRPPSRGAATSVGSLRAIPWVFAWAQSRCSLTGWYGLGTGLRAAVAASGVERLREMARGWRFFATLLSDAEMVLAKSDMGIARLYASLAGNSGSGMYAMILEEFERSCALIGEILGQQRLLEHNPRLARTLELRNPYVDPLHLIQVDFLARWRETERSDPELERVLAETVRGIARGMQNTG